MSSAPVVGVPTIPSGSQLTDAQLIDSVGINIHPDYTGTAYVQNGSADATLQSLLRLGVTNVRTRIDKQPTGYLATFFDQLASHHIGLMGIMGTPDGRWSTYGAGQSAQLLQSVTTGFYRGKVSALEMPNEWDANGGGSWSSDLGTFDKEYLGTMSASGLPIVGASMAQPSGYSSYRSAASTETRNLHPYAGSSMPEVSSVLPRWMSASSASSATSDVVATELGYHNALKATNGVSEQTSAAYLLRSLLWNRTHGVARSYIYELFDERPETAQTDREQHFGLVAVTGGSSASGWVQREKPAYTQLRGMLAFLRDTGTATGSPVAYTLSGAPSDLSVVPMLRSDGSTDIAIWRRVPVDANGNSAQAPVSLKFGSNVRTTVYDTATGSVRPLASSAASVDVSASGSVTIVRVAPAK